MGSWLSTLALRTLPLPMDWSDWPSPPQTCQDPSWRGHSSRRQGRWQPASTSWARPCCWAESSSSFYQWPCKSHVPRREREVKEVERDVDLCHHFSNSGAKLWTRLLYCDGVRSSTLSTSSWAIWCFS